jgi:hypothetical protein
MGFSLQFFRTDALPDFLIIGAQKAGTTSLASHLAAHPNVISPKWKEIHFFDLNYSKGVNWYRSHFPVGRKRHVKTHLRGQRLLAGDATPYYLLHPQAPFRAFSLVPGARIIVMLRDPVGRAYSHYHHEVRLGKESLSFEEAIEAEPSRIAGEAKRLEAEPSYESQGYQHFTYLERGLYLNQIRRWLRFYRPDQLLILSSEQFFEDPASEYKRVLRFLNLPQWELPSYPAEHVGKYSPIPAATRDRLVKYFAPHNLALQKYLNSNWSGSGDAIVRRFAS